MIYGAVKSAPLNGLAAGLFISLISLPAISATQISQTLDNTLHSHADIILTAEKFLSSNIKQDKLSRVEIQMGKLDPRLKLSKCNSPLTSRLAPGSRFSGKATVHVKCESSKPWTVYVNSTIQLYGNVLVTATPLDRDHIITRDDLSLSEIDLSRVSYGYFQKPESLIGKQLKRRLSQNKIVRVNYVKSPTLIKRGELVSIVAKNSQYSVKMSGTAMSNGSKGQRVQVKNLSSQRIVEGTVADLGVIIIN